MDKEKVTRDELRSKASIDISKIREPLEKMEFYESSEWGRLKRWYRKQHPLCELCLKEGRETPSREVHHISPISQGGDPLSVDNLIALCKDCHHDVHGLMGTVTINLVTGEYSSSLSPKSFYTDVVGTKEKNADGTDRQKVISQCRRGEVLQLVRDSSPGYNELIWVFRKSGQQIGRIDTAVARHSYLAYDMDHGCEVKTKIAKITGKQGNYGCTIKIKRGDLDRELEDKCLKKEKRARRLIANARLLEKKDPDKAVSLYQKAMKVLMAIDLDCKDHIRPWRYERYPINRLTMVLEQQKEYQECLKQIEKYELIKDMVGLTKTEEEGLHKRKARIIKKLS